LNKHTKKKKAKALQIQNQDQQLKPHVHPNPKSVFNDARLGLPTTYTLTCDHNITHPPLHQTPSPTLLSRLFHAQLLSASAAAAAAGGAVAMSAHSAPHPHPITCNKQIESAAKQAVSADFWRVLFHIVSSAARAACRPPARTGFVTFMTTRLEIFITAPATP
jgi:hypothetical protein